MVFFQQSKDWRLSVTELTGVLHTAADIFRLALGGARSDSGRTVYGQSAYTATIHRGRIPGAKSAVARQFVMAVPTTHFDTLKSDRESPVLRLCRHASLVFKTYYLMKIVKNQHLL